MRRYYPVGKLPKNPPRTIPYEKVRHPVRSRPMPDYQPQPYGWYDFPSPDDIDKGQKILVGIGLFLELISSEVGGEIIPFSIALMIMFILAGGLALLANCSF